MAVAISPLSSFLAGRSLLPVQKQPVRRLNPLSCRASLDKEGADPSGGGGMQLAKLAIVTLAAGVLTLGSVHEAVAAKSGGRVGGQAFRSAAPPRPSGPRINNSRTNIYVNPPVAPPLIGGYGYGMPYYGGWGGWSPFTFFAPGPSIAVGVGGGFDFFVVLFVLSAIGAVVRRFMGGQNYDDEDDF